MRIDYHRNFLKSFRKRIVNHPSLDFKFQERIKIFQSDPQNPLLQNHKLIGHKEDYWSFSISGDIRVIYLKKNNRVLFYDIGSHNQVY